MSNPSTPPQAVLRIVHKRAALRVCVRVCEFACARESWKKCTRFCACMSLWAPLTFGMLLPLMAQKRKRDGWQNLRCHGGGSCSSENQLKHTAQRHVAREHADLKAKRFLTSAVAECGKGVTWKSAKLNFRITAQRVVQREGKERRAVGGRKCGVIVPDGDAELSCVITKTGFIPDTTWGNLLCHQSVNGSICELGLLYSPETSEDLLNFLLCQWPSTSSSPRTEQTFCPYIQV